MSPPLRIGRVARHLLAQPVSDSGDGNDGGEDDDAAADALAQVLSSLNFPVIFWVVLGCLLLTALK